MHTAAGRVSAETVWGGEAAGPFWVQAAFNSQPAGAAPGTLEPQASGLAQQERRLSRYSEAAAGGSSWGGSGSVASGSGTGRPGSLRLRPSELEEAWEDAELAMLSPESQKRQRRRIANRDCARRIRQRKTELLAELATTVEALQADHTRLLATLTEVTRCWRDTTLENFAIRSQLALLDAGTSSSSGPGLASPPRWPNTAAGSMCAVLPAALID